MADIADMEAVLQALAEQVQALQLQVTEQQQTIAEQQAIMTALAAREEITYQTREEATPTSTGKQATRKTSRRRLFTSAGAAAAATAAAVIAGSPNVAHAASGDNWVLGSSTNNAAATTILSPSAGASPSVLVSLDNSESTGGYGLQVLGGPSGGTGVYGAASGATSYGVSGFSDAGTAVYGNADSGNGVVGTSSSGIGVVGSSAGGIGVQGTSTGSTSVGGSFLGERAALSLYCLASSPGAPTSGGHNGGDLYVDSAFTVWVCIATGFPGTWVRLTNVASTASGGAITYLSKPVRLLDSRPGATDALHNGGGPYPTGSTNSLTIAGDSFNGVTVPSTAVGAVGNVTVVTSTGANGYVAIVPHGAGFSGTSSINYSTGGAVIANFFNVGLSAGAIDIIVGGVGSTNVIIDVFAVVA